MVEDFSLHGPDDSGAASAGSRRELRARLRKQRLALTPPERMAAAESVARRFSDHLGDKGGYIAGYWAMNGELPLHVLQMRLSAQQRWCLPMLREDGRLGFGPWRPGDPLVSNRFGIPEPDLQPDSMLAPEDMAVVLLPLLGYTRAGQRLGMGGGYYDRSFGFRKRHPAPPLLVGVGYSGQEIGDISAGDWDVPLDAITTEREWIDCGR